MIASLFILLHSSLGDPNQYAKSRGLPALTANLSKFYRSALNGHELDPNEILITVGATGILIESNHIFIF